MAVTVGILMPLRPQGALGDPQSLPIGRAMLRLAVEGVRVVLGDDVRDGVMSGFDVVSGDWRAVRLPIDIAYDRFPSQSRPQVFAELLRNLGDIPLANPPQLTRLCRDKLACQHALERQGVPMPPVVSSWLNTSLVKWGAGFLKPRHGSFGRGVQAVQSPLAEPLVSRGPGAVRGGSDQMLLQRAVRPPSGWAGVSVRQLVQRDESGQWITLPAAVRRSRTDPVVNVARNAEVVPAEDVLSEQSRLRLQAVSRLVTNAIASDPYAVELGLDFCIDSEQVPWLIEVNSRPRGRLRVLAERDAKRFGHTHLESCCRPLRRLAAMVET